MTRNGMQAVLGPVTKPGQAWLTSVPGRPSLNMLTDAQPRNFCYSKCAHFVSLFCTSYDFLYNSYSTEESGPVLIVFTDFLHAFSEAICFVFLSLFLKILTPLKGPVFSLFQALSKFILFSQTLLGLAIFYHHEESYLLSCLS